MLQAAQAVFPGVKALAVKPDYGDPPPQLENTEVILAGHPVPNQESVRAAERALELVSTLEPTDLLLVLVSGGGSALWCAPHGISLEEKRRLTENLLCSGADIEEINAVRKHLSKIKGGRLAAATKARVLSLCISDVPSNDLSVVASGPTVPDPTSYQDALEVLERYRLSLRESGAVKQLKRGQKGLLPESPKPGDASFARVENRLVGSSINFLEAAKKYLEKRNYPVLILSDRFQGEARELARFHAGVVESIRKNHQPVAPPVVLLSGGEASVSVKGKGLGGRNQEFLLWLLYYLKGAGVWALAADTDGIDGNTTAAGAVTGPDSWFRALAGRLDPKDFLFDNNAYGFFDKLGDRLVTGPTANNLNDYRAILVF